MKERDGLGLQCVEGKKVGEFSHNDTGWYLPRPPDTARAERAPFHDGFRISDPHSPA